MLFEYLSTVQFLQYHFLIQVATSGCVHAPCNLPSNLPSTDNQSRREGEHLRDECHPVSVYEGIHLLIGHFATHSCTNSSHCSHVCGGSSTVYINWLCIAGNKETVLSH